MTIDHTEQDGHPHGEEQEILRYMLQREGSITVCDPDEDVMFSIGQQRLWMMHELYKDQSTPYDTITINLRIKGALDVGALSSCITEIGRRHDILRTTFRLVDDVPRLVVTSDRLEMKQDDPGRLSSSEAERVLLERMQQAGNTLFDLATGPLFIVQLLHLNDDDHALIVTTHRIIYDGWSNSVFLEELETLYNAAVSGEPSPLPPLSIQYRDFAAWQRKLFRSDVLQQYLAYWTRQLNELPPLHLPLDYPRPAVQTFEGAMESRRLSSGLSESLDRLSRTHGVTLFMTLLAALGVLLYRYTHEDDIAIGTAITNRDHAELQGMIGFFLNMLVLRIGLSGNPSFGELLERVKATTLDAYANQIIPYEMLIDQIQQERNRSRNPLFQVTFTLQGKAGATRCNLDGLDAEQISLPQKTARNDLEVYVSEGDDGLSVGFIYNTRLFKQETAQRLLAHYTRLLETVCSNASACIDDLPLLDTDEQQRLLALGTGETTGTSEQTLVDLFIRQVDLTPNGIAADFNGESLTYKALDARSNQLAHYLAAHGVTREAPVAVFMERSLEMVITLLAVIKAGAAYVPVDPELPEKRIVYILDNAGVDLVLSQQKLVSRLSATPASVICIDSERAHLESCTTSRPPAIAAAEDLCYVMFTSGSTGSPKGVMIEHRSVVNRLQWMQTKFRLDIGDSVLQKTPYGFDVSVWELFWPLCCGARLVIANPGGHMDPAYIAQAIRQYNISVVHFIPSMLKAYMEQEDFRRMPMLRYVICSGEVLTDEVVQQFHQRSDAALFNLYGPTEATIDVTCWESGSSKHDAGIPIGKPVSNTRIYILDEQLRPVPAGVSGELYIGGVQLARGYLNWPELTAEKFVRDPFSQDPDARMYKTGDNARLLSDGNIEYLGRRDRQIKLRGFRIELGEIEEVLAGLDGIAAAAVECRENANMESRLVAYAVLTEDNATTAPELHASLKSQLPRYMLPAVYVFLDRLPLNENGKIDRQALPQPPDEPVLTQDYVEPRTELEWQLAHIWRDILMVRNIGVNDNFFDLGGHSLMATRVVSRIRMLHGIDLQITDMFEAPTIAKLAEYIEATRWARQSWHDSTADMNTNQRQMGEL